jgi:hypothetical protein
MQIQKDMLSESLCAFLLRPTCQDIILSVSPYSHESVDTVDVGPLSLGGMNHETKREKKY